VREAPGRSLTQGLTEYLKPRELLLVLDNCEHLVEACARLAEALLHACPRLRILATSREPLAIPGERPERVPSLSLPDIRQLPEVEQLPQYEAVQLFVDRAATALPDFQLTRENGAMVATICARLDGIPLAIELAAARARALPLDQIYQRLDDRFRFLTGGSRTALPRHQTLRALIEWSYDLLSEVEKVLLRRLSVFAGGWTLEAAEAVCAGASDEERATRNEEEGQDLSSLIPHPSSLIPEDVLDLLTRLVDKSLVVYEDGSGEGRYRLLETIRQFAQGCLGGSDEVETIRRHVDYYLRLAETAEPHLTSPKPIPWLDRLEREVDNLRAVLAWAAERAGSAQRGDSVEVGLRLAAATHTFWQVRGRATEGRAWLAKLLALTEGERRGSLTPAVRARAFHAAGRLAWSQSDLNTSQTLFQRSLALAQEIGDRVLVARGLHGVGMIAGPLGDFRLAQQRLEESLAIYRELGDRRQIAALCNNLGKMALELGDSERARSLLEESLQIYRELGDRPSTKNPLCLLGALSMLQGDDAAALAYHEESLAISRELGDQRFIGIALHCLGTLARSQGDLETARARDTEALRLHHALEDRGQLMLCLVGLGCVAVMMGEKAARNGPTPRTSGIVGEERWFVRGARLFGVGEALREASGFVLWSDDRPSYERCVAAARAALGEEAFAAAWAEGRAMSQDDAVAYALEENTQPGNSPQGQGPSYSTKAGAG
jgi:non-specific serine/threonine protein kinase